MASFGAMAPKPIARMMLTAVMPSAMVAFNSPGAALVLWESCSRFSHLLRVAGICRSRPVALLPSCP